jgi:hypothetical protein
MATNPQHEADFGFPIVKLSNNRAQMGMSLVLRLKDNTPRGVQEKLFVGVTDYAATPHVYLSHAIDGPVFRGVAHEVLQHRFAQAVTEGLFGKDPASRVLAQDGVTRYQWTDFKGGGRADTAGVHSRILSLSFLDRPGHEYPWTLVLSEGPGRLVGAGAVIPTGAPLQRVQMSLSPMQLLQWMALGVEALAACTTGAFRGAR